MSAERGVDLAVVAGKLADTLPEAEQEGFQQDYIEIIGALNDKLDKRLTKMVHSVSELIHLYRPLQPLLVNNLLTQYCTLVRQTCEYLLAATMPIQNHAVRTVVMEALQAAVGYCVVAVREIALRAERRRGKRTS